RTSVVPESRHRTKLLSLKPQHAAPLAALQAPLSPAPALPEILPVLSSSLYPSPNVLPNSVSKCLPDDDAGRKKLEGSTFDTVTLALPQCGAQNRNSELSLQERRRIGMRPAVKINQRIPGY